MFSPVLVALCCIIILDLWWCDKRAHCDFRGFTIRSMTKCSNQTLLAYHIRLQMMDTTKRLTIALYPAVKNPGQDSNNWYWFFSASMPQCPKGIIQWQHGTFSKASNGSLTLTPFGVDGRQLLSNPCAYKQSIYTRYNQSEYFQVRYQALVYLSPFDHSGIVILCL